MEKWITEKKLHKMGINGKIWEWLHNFLHNREVSKGAKIRNRYNQAYCCLPGSNHSKFKTDKGLSQGSVLFCPFLIDIFPVLRVKKMRMMERYGVHG